MRIDESLQGAAERLRFMSDTALLDAQLLLSHVLNVTTSYFYSWPERVLIDHELAEFNALLKRREQGEPIAYILGKQAFWSLELAVAPCTLIPRADTECLVEQGVNVLAQKDRASVLDLGTGTGAIALALAKEFPSANVVGIDCIAEAVTLAQQNAMTNGIHNVQFIQSSWFDQIEKDRQFDLIVSNPPYIDPDDQHLSEGDVRFEPKSALVAENKGMADIEHIVLQAQCFLLAGGFLMFEHGFDQAQAVRHCMQKAGFIDVKSVQDFGGNDRVTLGRKPL